jgi:hypothetical protein
MALYYTAFIPNALMSGLFIATLVGRRGTRGQNMTIAISKWLGTLAATILLDNRLLIGAICCVLDIVYIGLVAWINKQGGVLPESPSEQLRRQKVSNVEELDELEVRKRLVLGGWEVMTIRSA